RSRRPLRAARAPGSQSWGGTCESRSLAGSSLRSAASWGSWPCTRSSTKAAGRSFDIVKSAYGRTAAAGDAASRHHRGRCARITYKLIDPYTIERTHNRNRPNTVDTEQVSKDGKTLTVTQPLGARVSFCVEGDCP